MSIVQRHNGLSTERILREHRANIGVVPTRETAQSKPSSRAHLYVICAHSTGLIKVGRSGDPKKRFAAIRTASGIRMSLVRILRNRGEEELAVHAALHKHRRLGEWFQDTQELRDDLCRMLGVRIEFGIRSPDAKPQRKPDRKSTFEGLGEEILGRKWTPAERAAFDAREDACRGVCSVADANMLLDAAGLSRLRLKESDYWGYRAPAQTPAAPLDVNVEMTR